ncbi:MAG: helix-turn-helix domain-containing protein, partial [Acidiphilium sp.]|nr:helix-turn-helix domain-containing protein [Acidiphilium sp.]
MNSMNGNHDTGMKIPEFQTSDLSGPARVGAELRGVRERLGWKLPDVATRLKIRLPFLEAIEAGDLSALPAPAYAAGFIRSYSETMGLDPDEILRRFRAEGMTRPKQPTLSFPEPVPDRGVPPGAIVFLVAVIGIGAYFLWYRHSEHELKMAQMVPAVPAKLAPLAVPKQPVPKVVTAPKPAVTAPSTATPASGNPDTAVASGQGQAPASTPTDSSVVTNGAAGPAGTAVGASTGTSGSAP